ncbi:hypothetical protein GGI26_004320 [Coemansia sp. RSA 1358]|uniref:Uncharacterized protein n=1 Tax=Coemansia umbellata TaxID=1424467 RepID=A0ABQ8PR35_9FUNG|nr:hypothetical protein EDC05_001698 [Coemansia umbellata]KAJ2621247.1 hypothetical protein GGI26_004320 [Coemansia sp. RSA 1358]
MAARILTNTWLLRYPSPTFSKHRRHLATGLVFIESLPNTVTSTKQLYDIAEPHAHIYGVWTRPDPLKSSPNGSHSGMASIRITTEPVPRSLSIISKLPDPTAEEIDRVKSQLMDIAKAVRTQWQVNCTPITKFPDMFQISARAAVGLGSETRRFDMATTDTPRFTKGLINGYREGFKQARRNKKADELLTASSESDDEIDFLIAYLSSTCHPELPV